MIFEHEKDVEIAKKRSQLPIAQERQRLVDMIRNNKVNYFFQKIVRIIILYPIIYRFLSLKERLVPVKRLS